MSEPGWYPDPGGRPGHYRFWDGQTWAPTTTTNPGGTFSEPPSGGERPGSGAPPSRGRRLGVILAVGAVALVLAVVAALVVRERGRIIDAGPVPTATSGPSLTAVPVPTGSDSPTPSARPSPRVTRPPTAEPCPVGNPNARQAYPVDDRVHGGGLSFPTQTGWQYPGRQASDFVWAYDVGQTDTPVQPDWYASYAVGAVSVADGFENPRRAARLAMACTVGSRLYRNVTSRRDLVNEATTVDGYPAWTLRSEIRADDDRTTLEGDTVQITVVDLDSPEALAFFWGCAPIGDAPLTAQLDQVVDQLRVG